MAKETLYEVGDEYDGHPAGANKFMHEIFRAGGLVEVDGKIVRVVYLPPKKEEPKVEVKKEEPKAEVKKEEPKAEVKKEEPKAETEVESEKEDAPKKRVYTRKAENNDE